MRLIDADWLEELLLAHEQNARAMVASGRKTSFTYADGIRTGYADVGLCPTIEAVPVVRCKDCKYHEDEENGMVYCPKMIGGWVEDDWFCADGEPKEENNGWHKV